MRRLAIAPALILFGAAAFFFRNHPPSSPPPIAPSPPANALLARPSTLVAGKTEAAAEFYPGQCSPLARPSPGAQLRSHLLAKLESKADVLDWRVITVEKPEGEIRLRLAREEGRLELRVYTVDAEGLPTLSSREKGPGVEAKMAEMAKGGRIISAIESKVSSGADYLRVEIENGQLAELEYRTPRGRLACAGGERFECRCL